MAKIHTIWNSEINIDDWQDYLEEEHPDVTDEYEKYRLCAELNDTYLDDERMNLNIPCDIIAIADLGFWNRRATGVQVFSNLKEIFYSECEYAKWFVEGMTLKGEMTHHDGTHYVKYYKFMKHLEGAEDFIYDLINEVEVSKSRFYKYCKSAGKLVKEVYGF